jgi:hypothetical protein
MDMNNFDPNTFNGINLEKEIEPMKTGKAKGWLGEYHWVQLPVTEDNKYSDLKTAPYDWCKEYFGSPGTRWFEKKDQFYFKDEKDMAMFILRWS